MSIKIFHCADLHLDSPFSLSGPSQAEQRRIELRSAFTSAIMIAKQMKTDLFFISGDLFDSEYVTRDTAELIISELGSFPDCKFFISPGNHDPYNDISPYKTMAFPDNVHIFAGRKEKIYIPELNCNIYGIGFTSSSYISSPVIGYGPLDDDCVNILVCHGDTSSPFSKYGPITKTEIASSGFDYIALGHIHSYSDILKEGKTYYAYPGCIEGRSYDEPGYHGAIVGTVEKGNSELKFVRISRRRYESVSIDISQAANKKEALDIIRKKVRPFGNDTSLSINLVGTVAEPFIISASEIGEGFEYPYKMELTDSTIPSMEFTDLESDTTLKGIFYSKMCERLNDCDPESDTYKTVLLALKYGISALNDRNISDICEDDTNE